MLNLYSDTKIYVPCPAGSVTGGAELLHQLVSFLRDNGKQAYIVYFDTTSSLFINYNIPNDYSCYNIATTTLIDDNAHNIEIIFENRFNTIKDRLNTQKILWWLSVDNFYLLSKHFLSQFDYMKYDFKRGLKMIVKDIFQLMKFKNKFKNRISIKYLSTLNVVNAYQSEYAQAFLLNHTFRNVVPLKDYINSDYFYKIDFFEKEDAVLYNPRKGFEFTKKLMDYAPDIKWIPLEGMNRLQLLKTIKSAKVYIDFGYHPGKDRLPRECAMSGCCVITGKKGSAYYFEDVPILDKYKFDESSSKIEDIISTIRFVLRNYHEAIDDFQFYRKSIELEKNEFEIQISKLFLL